MTASILSFVPTNVIHLEKRWENSFVVKFFHREGSTIKQGYIQVMVNNISLGMPHDTPLDISNSRFAHLSTLFLGTIILLHKLGASVSSFMFFFRIFFE